MRNSAIIKRSIAICGLSLMTSCYVGQPTFTNATMGSTSGYVAKPEYNGENRSAIYVSGEFGNSNVSNPGSGYLSDSENTGKTTFGALNIHRAHANKNLNFYYGVGAQLGTFKFSDESFPLEEPGEFVSAGNKSFYAFQVKTGINYLVSRAFADFRIIGLDLGFITESGPYLDTLEALETENLQNDFNYDELEVFKKPSTFYLGLSSEVLFKINEKNSLGVNPFIAKSFLESNGKLEPNIYGLTLSYRYSDFTFSFLNEVNSQYGVDAYTCKLGLAFKLN